jgi:archaellum biogenesis ATPase FlaH
MNTLIKYLYKIKILVPDDQKLDKWIYDNRISDVQFASKIGDYKARLLLIDKLSKQLENLDFQSIMIDFVNDKVPIVSKKAMSVLNAHSSMLDNDTLRIISEKEKYWIEQESKPKPEKKKVKFDQTWKDNEDKMVRLKQVRQQLKKSMYGERWM